MAFDHGLVERVADALQRVGESRARQKGVFGGRGFLIGKKTFVIVWGEGLIVRARPEEYDALLRRPGVTPFAPGGEGKMGTWLVVPDGLLAEEPELIEWVQRGLASVR